MERTAWIDMSRIHSAKVFVAGAGALGNETIKDLVLAGFRNITVADPDIVEESNLSRCILFRKGDIGRNKAETVSAAASLIDPDCHVDPVSEDVRTVDLSSYDILLGCLDNISARLHLNAHARYYGIPYVDGATDGFRGKVQTIFSEGPCMECGMNRTHIDELHRSFTCTPDGEKRPRDPVILSSGITTTSVIAGMVSREAIKIVCGRNDLCPRGMCYYDGICGTVEIMELSVNPQCPHHGDMK